MITSADIQYEPERQKIAYFGRTLILVAGDIGVHSQAIQDTENEIKGRSLSPHEIAEIYGRAIQTINRRLAENEILAPLGLNTYTFHAQQKGFSDSFVSLISGQLQNRRPIDTEALVVGSDGENAHIYAIDAYGNDTSLNGVGFGAIGIGAWHAKSRLMQTGHTSTRMLAPTLGAIFAAKKNAEIAPGVGSSTDVNIVLKDAIFPLWKHVNPELERLYAHYAGEAAKLGDSLVKELNQFITTPVDDGREDDPGPPGRDAQTEDLPTAPGESPAQRTATSEVNGDGQLH